VTLNEFESVEPRKGKHDFETCYEGTGLKDSVHEPYSEMGAALGRSGAVFVGLLPRQGYSLTPTRPGGETQSVVSGPSRVVAYFVTAPERPGRFEVRDIAGKRVAVCRATLTELNVTCKPSFMR
jgi:hypothetical protein